jgi:hypothetical protein
MYIFIIYNRYIIGKRGKGKGSIKNSSPRQEQKFQNQITTYISTYINKYKERKGKGERQARIKGKGYILYVSIRERER